MSESHKDIEMHRSELSKRNYSPEMQYSGPFSQIKHWLLIYIIILIAGILVPDVSQEIQIIKLFLGVTGFFGIFTLVLLFIDVYIEIFFWGEEAVKVARMGIWGTRRLSGMYLDDYKRFAIYSGFISLLVGLIFSIVAWYVFYGLG